MSNPFKVLKSKKGQGMLEYGIIISILSIASILIISALGNQVNTAYQRVSTDMTTAGIPASGS